MSVVESTGFSIRAVETVLRVPALAVAAGQVLCFVPPRDVLGADVTLARVLTTLKPPASGTLSVLGQPVAALDYMALLALRARLGFVPGQGGLLSNRSLRDNVALPVSVHRRRDDARVDDVLARFALGPVANLRPHQVDGATRFRACAARAVVLEPALLVVEGSGDFDVEERHSRSWQGLLAARQAGAALLVCLPRPMQAFTDWITAQGAGTVTLGLAHSEETT